ncbi:MAG: hypothetical protein HXY24_07660 [Rubrivivax sp.]|nr:hypothetical protein [Rubrivivax sp.]
MGSMMQTIRRWLAMLAVVALAACGGGSDEAGKPIFGGGSGGTATASGLTLTLSAPSVNNSGTEIITATATAVDANRNTVAGIPVTISVEDEDATVKVSGATTDSNGVVAGQISIGANKANRTIKVTATSGKLKQEASFAVVGTRITATALPAVLEPSQPGRVEYRVLDASGSAIAGIEMTVTGPDGVESRSTTGANGDVVYTYKAPAVSGSYDIRATAGGAADITSIVVQAGSGAIPPVPAGSVGSASVRANPSVVPVNTSTTANRAEVRALFVGSNNAPIRNVRVRFDLDGDQNSIGGTFTSGGALVYSDANGIAVTSYVPGSRFSPTDGVTIRACWDYDDFPAGTCPNQATTTLTVISDALSVTIGTDELIVTPDLVYVKRFVVQVNDSSGVAKPDVLVSPLLDLTSYQKGFWTRPGDAWEQTVTTAGCGNEDVNRNGVLEVYANGDSEDANGNLSLDPRKADVTVAIEGSNRTDALGQVKLRLTYPRNVASWVEYKLTVAASGVAGTEGRASFAGLLSVPADAVKSETTPAFVRSPYGVEESDFVFITDPRDPSGNTVASLCTNPR